MRTPSRVGVGRAALYGAGLGAAWGVVARVWMRFISTDPEFTWSGTGYIVLAPTIVGLLVGAAIGAEARTGRLRTVLRGAAGGSVVLLGAGAGMLMVPSIVFAGLGLRRPPLPLWMRLLPIPFLFLVAGMVGLPGGMVTSLGITIVSSILLVAGRGVRVALAVGAALPASVVVGSLFDDLSTSRASIGSVIYLVLLAGVVFPYARAIGAAAAAPERRPAFARSTTARG